MIAVFPTLRRPWERAVFCSSVRQTRRFGRPRIQTCGKDELFQPRPRQFENAAATKSGRLYVAASAAAGSNSPFTRQRMYWAPPGEQS